MKHNYNKTRFISFGVGLLIVAFYGLGKAYTSLFGMGIKKQPGYVEQMNVVKISEENSSTPFFIKSPALVLLKLDSINQELFFKSAGKTKFAITSLLEPNYDKRFHIIDKVTLHNVKLSDFIKSFFKTKPTHSTLYVIKELKIKNGQYECNIESMFIEATKNSGIVILCRQDLGYYCKAYYDHSENKLGCLKPISYKEKDTTQSHLVRKYLQLRK